MENVFFHGQRGPFTVQLVYDPAQPLGRPYCGRVLDIHGKTAHQTEWVSGNGPAIDGAKAWCRSPEAKEYKAVAPEEVEAEPEEVEATEEDEE